MVGEENGAYAPGSIKVRSNEVHRSKRRLMPKQTHCSVIVLSSVVPFSVTTRICR